MHLNNNKIDEIKMKTNTQYRTKQIKEKAQETHTDAEKHSFSEEFHKNRKPEAIMCIQKTYKVKKEIPDKTF